MTDHLTQARQAESAGDWNLAFSEWQALAEQRPKAVSAYMGQARSLLSLDRLEDALAIYRAGAERFPDRPEFSRAIERVSQRQQRLAGRAALQQALDRAQETEKQSQWHEALEIYQQALVDVGSRPALLLGVGRNLERLARFSEARRVYVDALAQHPEIVEISIALERVEAWLSLGAPQRELLHCDARGPVCTSPAGTSGHTAIFFINTDFFFSIPVCQLDWYFACRNISVVYVLVVRAAPFLHGLPDLGLNFEGMLQRFVSQLDSLSTQRLSVLGVSGGGADALRVGAALGADEIGVFCAGFNLTSDFCEYFEDPEMRASIEQLNGIYNARQLDQRLFLEHFLPGRTRVWACYGAESTVDRVQAEYVADLPQVTLQPQADCERHNSAAHLLNKLELFPYLDRLLLSDPTATTGGGQYADSARRFIERLYADINEYEYFWSRDTCSMLTQLEEPGRALLQDFDGGPVHVSPPGSSGITVLFFLKHSSSFEGLPFTLLDRYFAARNMSVIYIRERRSQVYLNGLPALDLDQDQAIAHLQSLCAELQTRVLCTVGFCGAAMGALSYGAGLKADVIAGFASAVNLHDDFIAKNGDPRAEGSIRRLNKRFDAGQLDAKNALSTLPASSHVNLFYCAESRYDVIQAQHVSDLPQVRLHPVPGNAGQYIAHQLISRGELFQIFDDCFLQQDEGQV